MEVPPFIPETPVQQSQPNAKPKSSRTLWIVLAILGVCALVCIGAVTVLVQKSLALSEQGPHPLPSNETLLNQMVVFDAVCGIAVERKYPEEENKPDEAFIKELTDHINTGPWNNVSRQIDFINLSSNPDLESDQFWQEFYLNEEALTIAWALGLTHDLPPLHQNAYLPINLAEPTQEDHALLLKAAKRRSAKNLAQAALEYEAWIEVINIYYWKKDGDFSGFDESLYVTDMLDIIRTNDLPIRRQNNQWLYDGVPFNEMDEEDINGIYWRATARARALAWVRGYAKTYEEAEPQGPYSYFENMLNNSLEN